VIEGQPLWLLLADLMAKSLIFTYWVSCLSRLNHSYGVGPASSARTVSLASQSYFGEPGESGLSGESGESGLSGDSGDSDVVGVASLLVSDSAA
jgi:hypothetical protein